MNKNIPKGKRGECLAEEHLVKQGFKIIERNWRYSRLGEIDIIAEDGDALVFVEVKTRTSCNFGHPAEAITSRKGQRMRKLAEVYINKINADKYKNFRIDLIGILAGKNTEITHIKNI